MLPRARRRFREAGSADELHVPIARFESTRPKHSPRRLPPSCAEIEPPGKAFQTAWRRRRTPRSRESPPSSACEEIEAARASPEGFPTVGVFRPRRRAIRHVPPGNGVRRWGCSEPRSRDRPRTSSPASGASRPGHLAAQKVRLSSEDYPRVPPTSTSSASVARPPGPTARCPSSTTRRTFPPASSHRRPATPPLSPSTTSAPSSNRPAASPSAHPRPG